MLAELSIEDFLEKVASDTPLPAGGSVTALIAALGASLAEMAARRTIGKKGYESVQDDMKAAALKAAEYRKKLIAYIDKDTDAYTEVMLAYQLPKTAENRSQAIEAGLKQATLIPADLARYASDIMKLAQFVAQKGSRHCAPDAQVGAMFAETAATAALYNVSTNLQSISDKAFATDILRQTEDIKNMIESKITP